MEWIDNVLRDVAELPDRNSPEDWPEAMLVTGDELRQIIVTHAPAEPVNARLLDVAVWPAGYCRDPNGKMSIPAGKEEDFNFGYDVGFQEAWEILNSAISAAGKSPTSQQERLLQDMHDAGREIDRVMAEPAPKAVRLTEDEIVEIRRVLAGLGCDTPWSQTIRDIETAVLRKNGIEVAE